jgi:hypothetical protein
MEYLHAALSEALRLYPSVPVDHKEARVDPYILIFFRDSCLNVLQPLLVDTSHATACDRINVLTIYT